MGCLVIDSTFKYNRDFWKGRSFPVPIGHASTEQQDRYPICRELIDRLTDTPATDSREKKPYSLIVDYSSILKNVFLKGP